MLSIVSAFILRNSTQHSVLFPHGTSANAALIAVSHLIMTAEPDLLVAAGFSVSYEESLQLAALGDEMFGLEGAIASEY